MPFVDSRDLRCRAAKVGHAKNGLSGHRCVKNNAGAAPGSCAKPSIRAGQDLQVPAVNIDTF
jgi:hypothetical protein